MLGALLDAIRDKLLERTPDAVLPGPSRFVAIGNLSADIVDGYAVPATISAVDRRLFHRNPTLTVIPNSDRERLLPVTINEVEAGPATAWHRHSGMLSRQLSLLLELGDFRRRVSGDGRFSDHRHHLSRQPERAASALQST